MDRRRIAIVSDVVRALVALGSCWSIRPRPLLYLLSGLLMFASPFPSGRAAILPAIASPAGCTPPTRTQTTLGDLMIGTMLAGFAVATRLPGRS
jgi:hypothetical protein